jgi:hypothetical protein
MNKLLNIGQWTLGVFFGLMALAGLLSFNLYGVGIFVCFVIATAFTIPPILAKIRAARKKQGKEISTNFAVLGAGFFAICGIVFMVNSGEKTIKESLPYPAEQVQFKTQPKTHASKQTQLELETLVYQWLEAAKNNQWQQMLPLIQASYRRNRTDNELIRSLKVGYDEGILSYDVKSIETIKNGMFEDGMFYKLNLEVTTQYDIYKFSPNIIKEQGVWGINPVSADLRPKFRYDGTLIDY